MSNNTKNSYPLVAKGFAGALLLLTLAGCAASSPAAAPATVAPTVEPSPTPTVDPGPVTLSEDEAADRYLSIVCPSNKASDVLVAAFQAGEDEFLNGGAPDPAAVKKAANIQLALHRESIELLDDDYFVWPENVADHVEAVRDGMLAELSPLDATMNAATFEEAFYVTWPDFEKRTTGAQEIRYQLGISPDTTSSCKGFEDGHDVLLTERNNREAALGSVEE